MKTLILKSTYTLTAALTLLTGMTAMAQARDTTVATLVCALPYHDPDIVGPAVLDTPIEANAANGTTIVKVTLTATGAVANAQLADSSTNFWLDLAAVRTARKLTYTPETQGCQSIAGSYLVQFVF